MKITRFVFFAALMALLAGCSAVPYQQGPIIDIQGQNVDPARYQFDLDQCRQIASQVDPGSNAAANAAAGAVVMGIIGAIFGGSRGAAQGAGVGAVAGGVSGGANSVQAQRAIVANCMTGRGYRVLAY